MDKTKDKHAKDAKDTKSDPKKSKKTVPPIETKTDTPPTSVPATLTAPTDEDA
jgi:hypothetical protein